MSLDTSLLQLIRMERTDTVFDAWFNNTNKMMQDWKKVTEEWSGDQNRMWAGVGQMQQQWMDG